MLGKVVTGKRVTLPAQSPLVRASDISHGRGPAKSREILKNTRNSAKSARNISKYMSAKHIYYLSWFLPLFYSPQMSKFILKLRHCNEQTTSQNYQAFLD